MKKNGFILTAIGLIFLLLNYEVRFTLSQEQTILIDVIPDFVGFLLIFFGLKYIGRYTVNMRAGTLAAFAGILVSFIQTALKQSYGTLVGFRVIFEVIYSCVLVMLFFTFTYGIALFSKRVAKSVAEKSKGIYAGSDVSESDFSHLSAIFSAFGRLYCISVIVSCIVNIVLIFLSNGTSALSGIGIVFAALTIILGVVKAVFMIAIIVVSFRASVAYDKVTLSRR